MYTQAVESFRKSKETQDNSQAREAIKFTIDLLRRSVDDFALQAKFIEDGEYIFPVEHEWVSPKSGVDYTFSTSGYLVQVLSLLGIANAHTYVVNVQEALEDVHSELSSQNDVSQQTMDRFNTALDSLENLLE